MRAPARTLFAVFTAACGSAPSRGAVPVPARPASTLAPPDQRPFSRPLDRAERRWVDSVFAAMSRRDRVAQLVTVWVLGDYTSFDDSSFVQVRRWIAGDHVGGVLLSLGSPLEVAAKVNVMQQLALASGPRIPLLVSSDLEPGLGRLEGGVLLPDGYSGGSATVFPSNMAIGATGRPADAELVGRIVGREARAVGIHVNFAPTADVNSNPANPVIGARSFGEAPDVVAAHTAAFVRGLQGEGVAAVVKHFPGHGDTDTDSHLALPVIRADRARLDAVELVPFRAAIRAEVAGVMSAHIALPAIGETAGVPATLSPRVMTALLRDTLRFRGVVFTDAMTMDGIGSGYTIERSCPLAVAAGADVLLYPSDAPRCIDAVVAAVQDGSIPRDRLDASVRRVLELKVRTGAVSRPLVNLDTLRATVGAAPHRAAARAVARRAVTLLRDTRGLVPIGGADDVAVVVYAPENELLAGQTFVAALRAGHPGAGTVRDFRITPRTSPAALDSITQATAAAARLVIMTYTRSASGAGHPTIPAHIAEWVGARAAAGYTVVVAAGNPYVIRQFPTVPSYLVTFGRGNALEQAAASALNGATPISGRTPVSLPGIFSAGDGLRRDARGAR